MKKEILLKDSIIDKLETNFIKEKLNEKSWCLIIG